MTNSVSSTLSKKYTLASFFAGVGGIELGFEKTGEFRVVYANEFDKHAQETYQLNFPDIDLDGRDIHDVVSDEIPQVDVITGGFPCQAFSIAGYRKGFEDERGDLFFELLRMITHKRPRAIFIENVKNMVTHDHGNTFKVIREALVSNGYYIKWKVLNTKDYGNIPQNRERIYIVGFLSRSAYNTFYFPTPTELETELSDVIDYEKKFDEAFYYRKGKQPFYEELAKSITEKDTIYQWRRRYVRKNKNGVVPTLTANMGTGGHNVPLVLTSHGIRKLTPRETFNVQGFPKSFKLPENMAKSHLYKQAGNSVSVPVIERIAENIYTALKQDKREEDFSFLENEKYVVIYTDIHGRYSGKSHIIDAFDSREKIKNFKANKQDMVFFLEDDDYIGLIKKGLSADFYTVINLSEE